MAYKSLKDVAKVFVAEYDVRPILGAPMNIKRTALLSEFRQPGEVWTTAVDLGIRSCELTMPAYLNSPGSDSISGIYGTNRIVSILHEGNTVSDRFFGIQSAIVSGIEVGISDDMPDTLTPEFTVRGETNYGYVAAPWVERTTAGNTDTTYATMQAPGATGHAFLHVTALTLGGYTSCTITVRTSTDHITFNPHTAFGAVSNITSEVLALSSTVNQYLSVSWAWNGAGTGQSITFFAGVAID